VDGWAGTPESLLLHELFMGVQVGCDNGGAFEIGVHHGRYLIALHNACQPGTSSLGIDLFDDQALNVDGSGSGDLAKARANLEQFAREPELAHLQSADSLALTDEDLATITETYAPFRIASVDGGHTPTHAAQDIRTAARLVAPGGLISVDDFFHPKFPRGDRRNLCGVAGRADVVYPVARNAQETVLGPYQPGGHVSRSAHPGTDCGRTSSEVGEDR
jgi:hypothetical protein